MIRYFFVLTFLTLTINICSYGQQKIEKKFSYTTDFAFNLSGGNQTGFAWLGCFQASLYADTETFKLWKNGKLKFSYISTHGSSFSDLTGDMQIASNIEAGQMATTFELWYQHNWNNVQATLGFIDLNAFFSFSDLALSLINSSFGIQPTISGNMPVPIYPITSLGAVIRFQGDQQTAIQLGVFDGTPSMYKDYQLIPDINWKTSQGIFAIAEFSHDYRLGMKPGVTKVGYWMHTQNIPSHHFGEYSTNHGFYVIAELELFKLQNKHINIWGKFGGAPRDCNVIRFFNGGGISFLNYSGKNKNDVIAAGFGQAILCHEYKRTHASSRNETVVELTLRKEYGIIALQPDLQYIIQPSGCDDKQNPLCFIFRVSATL